jgi:hypothetical protein
MRSPARRFERKQRGRAIVPVLLFAVLAATGLTGLYSAAARGAVKVDNFNWCGTGVTAPSACAASRATFGTGTTRASYQVPRNYRLTALVRF